MWHNCSGKQNNFSKVFLLLNAFSRNIKYKYLPYTYFPIPPRPRWCPYKLWRPNWHFRPGCVSRISFLLIDLDIRIPKSLFKLSFTNIWGLNSKKKTVHHFLKCCRPHISFLIATQVSFCSSPNHYLFHGYLTFTSFRMHSDVCAFVHKGIFCSRLSWEFLSSNHRRNTDAVHIISQNANSTWHFSTQFLPPLVPLFCRTFLLKFSVSVISINNNLSRQSGSSFSISNPITNLIQLILIYFLWPI